MGLLPWILTSLLACAPTAEGPPDLVLISIDGMRADHAHFNGYPRPTTPSLDVLAAEGLSFSRAFSASNESLYSHASLLSGLEVAEVALPDYGTYHVPATVTTVAEALSANGYQTAAFVAGGHVKASFGFDQGFATFEEGPDFGSFFDTVPPARAWWEATAGPRFLFVHGYDCHRPYGHASVFYHPFDRDYRGVVDRWVKKRNATERIVDGVYYPGLEIPRLLHATGISMSDPDGYLHIREATAAVPPWKRVVLNDADLAHLVAHYDSGVLAADTYVGMLLDALRSSPRWDRTLVIVVSDHGEDLQDHGLSNHRATLTDATTHVPLLLGGGALPPELRGRRLDTLVAATDIVPTILDVAGVVPLAGNRGHSLRPCWESHCPAREGVFQLGVLGQLAFRSADWRLVVSGYAPLTPDLGERLANDALMSGHFALYHSGQEPIERTDQLAAEPERARALRAELVRAWKAQNRSSAVAEPPPEVRAMLQEHGYW